MGVTKTVVLTISVQIQLFSAICDVFFILLLRGSSSRRWWFSVCLARAWRSRRAICGLVGVKDLVPFIDKTFGTSSELEFIISRWNLIIYQWRYVAHNLANFRELRTATLKKRREIQLQKHTWSCSIVIPSYVSTVVNKASSSGMA